MKLVYGCFAFLYAALIFGCFSSKGGNVEYIAVMSHDQAEPIKIADKDAIRPIMTCYNRKVREVAKFPRVYTIAIHYKDGSVVEAMVGDGYLKDARGVSYKLDRDMAAMLREAIAKSR